jgi:hypothetical protein
MNIHQKICARAHLAIEGINLRIIGDVTAIKHLTSGTWRYFASRLNQNRYMSQKDWSENRFHCRAHFSAHEYIRIIAREHGALAVTPWERENIIAMPKRNGRKKYICLSDGTITCIDNRTGKALTETFPSFHHTILWLRKD